MLKSIVIKGLYGLHSYSLDFKPERKPYCFVTGPNAYGKTTLLRMLDFLYNQDFNGLADIAFGEFRLLFDDGFHIVIVQERIYDASPDSDEITPRKIVLMLSSGSADTAEETWQWESDREKDEKLNNVTAYLASHPIYMITDNRLYKGGTGESVGGALEGSMKKYLQDLERELNADLQQRLMDEQEHIGQAEYSERGKRIQPLIDSVMKYGLVRRNPLPAYSEEKAAFCHTCLKAVEETLQNEILGKIARLDAFCLIIDNYGFAKKKMELSPYFGFRFKAEDDMASILSFDQLSSGERHIVLMNYDILFDVDDEALVLIDEPELSFHLEWQGQFMANLEELTGTRNDLQYIICTHAPEMFGYEWDASVDLKEQSEN